jgi:hypothetical protein
MVQQLLIFSQYVKQVLKCLVSEINNEKKIVHFTYFFSGQKGFKHATDTGYYGRGAYFSVRFFNKSLHKFE